MRKLSLILLAAAGSMLATSVAQAQHGPRPGSRPGATWRGGGMTGPGVRGPNIRVQTPGPRMHGGGQAGRNIRMHGGGNVQVRTGGGFRAHGGGGHGFHRWGPHPGRNFRHGRLRRGGIINSYWFAPQFNIGNWQAYGFYAPGADQRWVRYYDDAYLIDGYGRVMDERYGVDWGGYGEEWGDDDGIPAYRGEWAGSAEESDEAYAYDEDYAEAEGDANGGGMMPPPPGYGPPPPGAGQVMHGGYAGYGYYAYPIVIETVTTTSGGYTEEIVEEEYVEVRQQRRRAHRPRRPRCACTRPAPRPAVRRPAPRPQPARRPARPPAGERG